MFAAPADRFVLATVGWEPRYAVIGRDLKATFFAFDAALGDLAVTDPHTSPWWIATGGSRSTQRALRAFRERRPAPGDDQRRTDVARRGGAAMGA